MSRLRAVALGPVRENGGRSAAVLFEPELTRASTAAQAPAISARQHLMLFEETLREMIAHRDMILRKFQAQLD